MKVRRGAAVRYPPVWTRPRAHLYSCSTPDSANARCDDELLYAGGMCDVEDPGRTGDSGL